jgi:hypothetical protein
MDFRNLPQDLIRPVGGKFDGADSVPLPLEAKNVPIYGLLGHAEFLRKSRRRMIPAFYEREKVVKPSGDRKRPRIAHSVISFGGMSIQK